MQWLTLLAPLAAALAAWWLAALLYDLLRFTPFARAARPRKGLGKERWAPHKLASPPDALVIGSGMAGLSAAALLSTFGYRVVVLEQHETAGGGAHTYAVDGRAGWKFDSGLHYTIPQAAALLALACGARAPPVRVSRMGVASAEGDVYDRVRLEGAGHAELRIAGDAQLVAELTRRFPALAAPLQRFVACAARLLAVFPLWCASSVLPHPLRALLLRSPLFAHWRAWASRPATDALEAFFPGDAAEAALLKSYLSALWIDAGSPPHRMSFFMAAALAIGFPHVGGAYPDGGPEEMANALVEAVEARGGQVFVRAAVEQVLVERRGGRDVAVGVRLADGSEVRSGVVVSACGYRLTTGRLLPPAVARKHALVPDELTVPQSDGFVMCNIAVEGSAEELGLDATNLWLQPCAASHGYSLSKGVQQYLSDPLGVPLEHVPLMITVPSAKDRTWHASKPNRTMIQTLALAPYAWFAAHQADERPAARHAPPHLPRLQQEQYDSLKAAWRERCLELVYTHFPKVRGRVAFADVSTPLTIEHYLPSTSGSAIGLDVVPARFTDLAAIKRLDMKTGIRNLWLTGQDTLLCGQPLAQMSGIFTALRIIGPFRFSAFLCRLVRFHIIGGGTRYSDLSTW